jgi:hypothetical protein
MKQSKVAVTASLPEGGRKVGPGKRSLYRPELGASNYRRAEGGRFASHPAFVACMKLWGVFSALCVTSTAKSTKRRLPALVNQMDKALGILRDEAKELKGRGDKLRFAEAIAAFFDPSNPDGRIRRLCWRALEMRAARPKPSQAQLRRLLAEKDKITWSDEGWKRVIKRVGINREFPTHRERIQGGRLRKV